jgi:ABC-type lipoprotein export system ATPase subunit
VDAGELVVLRGRSGSGKSTLIAIAAGWCLPDDGDVLVDGASVVGRSPAWSLVSVVPQVLALPAELTLAEAVADAVVSGPGSDALVTELLSALDLESVAHRPPDMVSAGQQQRAAVARALVAGPLVILADEPTSHQDPAHTAAVVRALRLAADGGAAVLVASHDHLVADAATRVVDLFV